jgi:hypothetical protein
VNGTSSSTSLEPGVERNEERGEPLEVCRISRVADVEIACEAWAGLDYYRNAADDYEIDLGLHQRADQGRGTKVRPTRHG